VDYYTKYNNLPGKQQVCYNSYLLYTMKHVQMEVCGPKIYISAHFSSALLYSRPGAGPRRQFQSVLQSEAGTVGRGDIHYGRRKSSAAEGRKSRQQTHDRYGEGGNKRNGLEARCVLNGSGWEWKNLIKHAISLY